MQIPPPSGPAGSRAAGLLVIGCVLLVASAAATDLQKAQESLARGIELLQEKEPREALRQFQRAVEEEPTLAAAHYYMGMAYGQLQRYPEAYEAFVTAAALEPGNGEVHKMACIVAFYQGDYAAAWDQAILAGQAGIDMSQAFLELEQRAPPPSDWRQRLEAPRVLVDQLDIAGLVGRDSRPFAPQQAIRGAEERKADERGGGINMDPFPGESGLTSSEDRFLPPSGSGLAAQVQAELHEVWRQFGVHLADSPAFGLVQQVERANYILRIQVDDMTEEIPRKLVGHVKLLDAGTGREIHSRPLELRNTASVPDLRNDVERYVGYLETWLRGSGPGR